MYVCMCMCIYIYIYIYIYTFRRRPSPSSCGTRSKPALGAAALPMSTIVIRYHYYS